MGIRVKLDDAKKESRRLGELLGERTVEEKGKAANFFTELEGKVAKAKTRFEGEFKNYQNAETNVAKKTKDASELEKSMEELE